MNKRDIQRLTSLNADKEPSSDWLARIQYILQKDIVLFNGFNAKAKETFYHELSILLDAGIDLKSAIDLIIEEQQKEQSKAIISNIGKAIEEGVSFSQALREQKSFTPYEYFSLQIGEETGKLSLALANLANYYKKILKQRRQVTGAMVYPMVVLCTSFGAIFFMLNFIVPMFADIFKRSGNSLPAITLLVVQASEFMKRYGLIFLIIFGLILYFLYNQRKKDWHRRTFTTLLLKLPIFGDLIRKVHLSRFCNSMALLTGSKVPLVSAIHLSKKMSGFYPIEKSLEAAEGYLTKGKSLFDSLSNFPIYDKRMLSLIKVGEEVNQLSSFFQKVASQYEEDIDHQSSLLSSAMEPFIIIFLGVIVGFILIAMYLPLFQMGNGFQ